jgi:hypothetical protein
MPSKIVKKSRQGAALIETAFTLPIICYLIFFIFELMKIHITQTAIDTIAAEATFYFIVNKNIMEGTKNKIDEIIAKHRPSFIPATEIRYYFNMFHSLESMCSASPYGGSEIAYLNATDRVETDVGNYDYIDSDQSQNFLAQPGTIAADLAAEYVSGAKLTPSGTAFTLTVVCAYKFSGSFIKMLFNGGVNTKNGSGRGSTFLLWKRGVGIIGGGTPAA